jgi:hypothetical protein
VTDSVWALHVDIQTKTATFQSGLGDAARAARASFSEIRDGASGMSSGVSGAMGDVSYSTGEARHSVMELSEIFGAHIPRSLTTAISSIGGLGPALEAAFPYLSLVLGATLLAEHIAKIGEAEKEVLEASHKLSDGMAEGVNKADQQIVNEEIAIRRLAGEPAWDLLAKKLRLEDAAKGFENVSHLENEVKRLLEAAPASSNWNPFNWGDGSNEVQAKAKALQEQMRGKDQSEQADVLKDALALQSKILEEMKGQQGASEAALKNQATYVDFLKQEAELIQKQVDGAALADQRQQGEDRAKKIQAAEEEQRQITAAQQRGLEEYVRHREEAERKVDELRKKSARSEEELAQDEIRAQEVFSKYMKEQAEEISKLNQEAGKENAAHMMRMAQLQIEADRDAFKARMAVTRMSQDQILDAEMSFSAKEYETQKEALNQELAALDQNDKEYVNRKMALNNKLIELEKQFHNQQDQLLRQSQQQEQAEIQSAEMRVRSLYATGFANVIMGKESFGKMMRQVDSEIASSMLEHAITSMMALDMTKEREAAAAARKGFLAGEQTLPGVAGVVLGGALAAAAFASVMAFEEGGIVPGVGKGDIVPAMLTPGEGVLTNKQMEHLQEAARGDAPNGGQQVHIHHHATYHVQAFDSDGVRTVLREHGDQFAEHVGNHLRRLNK